jgi:catechol 2,3-dioxygenase-like lactoylglutathione lyase family enzyme
MKIDRMDHLVRTVADIDTTVDFYTRVLGFDVVTGAIDLCLIASTPLAEVIDELNALGIAIEEGPIDRTGATGPIRSVYLRDPDQNLIEISNYGEQ